MAPSAPRVTFLTPIVASRSPTLAVSSCSETEVVRIMWERTDRSARPAREFADAHDLDYSGTVPAVKAHSIEALPFTEESLRHCVSGQWRGRFVQRFETGHYTVELMTMSGALPSLHVIPSGLNFGALAIEGRVATTGDPAFDRRWTLVTENPDFAAALMTPHMREALMHPAASGRAFSFHGDRVLSWAAQRWVMARCAGSTRLLGSPRGSYRCAGPSTFRTIGTGTRLRNACLGSRRGGVGWPPVGGCADADAATRTASRGTVRHGRVGGFASRGQTRRHRLSA